MFSLLLGAAFSFTCSPATGMTSQTDISAKAWPCCCIHRMVDLTSTYPCPVVKFSETIQICLINQTEQFWEQFPNRLQNDKKKFCQNIFYAVYYRMSSSPYEGDNTFNAHCGEAYLSPFWPDQQCCHILKKIAKKE